MDNKERMDNDSSIKLEFNGTTYQDKSDFLIWRDFKSGSKEAYLFIYETYFTELYSYGCQFSKDKTLVEDSIQDLFIDIHDKKENLSDTTSIKFYLYRSLRRKIHLYSKKHEKHNHPLENTSHFPVSFSVEDHIIEEQEKSYKLHQLNKALDSLTPRQREILYYFYYQDFSYKEISQIMGFRQVRSVRNLLYKAIGAAKDILVVLSIILYISICNYKLVKLSPLIENV